MKIMSFNTQHCLNYVERKIDFEIMARAITEIDADVVGLNEMRGDGVLADYTDQTGALSALTGIQNSYFAKAIDVGGVKAPYGNALLSKYRIVSKETILVPDPDPKNESFRNYETRCLLKARLSCGITVMVIHFGLNPDEQENAVKTVMENLEGERCVLMGDFNVTPDSKILDPIREKMVDTASVFDCEKFSFPSDTPRKKIDYIFVTPDATIVSADIPVTVASDHRPHTAEIRF